MSDDVKLPAVVRHVLLAVTYHKLQNHLKHDTLSINELTKQLTKQECEGKKKNNAFKLKTICLILSEAMAYCHLSILHYLNVRVL